MIAKEQVVGTVRFDIHMERDIHGHRYVQRITEIVPTHDSRQLYRLNNIVEYREGKYVMTGQFSRESSEEILSHLEEEDRQRFIETYHI